MRFPSLGWPSEDDADVWDFAFSFAGRMVAYIILLAAIVAIITLVLKWIGEYNERTTEEAEEQNEITPLLPNKTVTYTYGTCDEPDLESGGNSGGCCDASCSSNSNDESSYDKKVCVICFDEERDCFFVPCGHSATCQSCAIRIFYEENRMCPVCRRFIGKLRKFST